MSSPWSNLLLVLSATLAHATLHRDCFALNTDARLVLWRSHTKTVDTPSSQYAFEWIRPLMIRGLGQSCFFFWVLGCSAFAWAHDAPGRHDLIRHMRIEVSPSLVQISLSQIIGKRIAQVWRQRMDTNRDGVISDREKDVFLQLVGKQSSADIQLWSDGQRVVLRPLRHAIGLVHRRVTATAFGYDVLLQAALVARQGLHHLRVWDRAKTPHQGHMELDCVAAGGALLRHARLWNQPPGEQFGFRLPLPTSPTTPRRDLRIAVLMPTLAAAPTSKLSKEWRFWLCLSALALVGFLLWRGRQLHNDNRTDL